MASKIETELTPTEVVDFLEELANSDGGTRLRTIKEAAAERGVEVSLMSARTFRDGALVPYLDKIKGFRQKAEGLAKVLTGDDESPLLDAARLALSEQLLDFLMGGELQPKQFAGMAKAVASLSGSDQAERMTRVKLEKARMELDEMKARGKAILEDEGSSEEEKAAEMRGLFGIT